MFSLLRLGPVLVALVLASTVGCKEKNDLYCEGHPDDVERCPQPDAGVCMTDDDCPGQVCDTASGACVQCTTDKADACTGTTPLCGDDHTCRACTTHAECTDSNVCLPSGACASASEVAYVSASGTSTACTKPSPCPLLSDALATNLPYVKIAADGAANASSTVVIDGQAVAIFAEPGAKLDRDGDGPILEVRSANADVSIYDLTITGASGDSGVGVLLVPNGGQPTLALTRVTVSNNRGGLSLSGGMLTLTESIVSGNSGDGISMSGGALTVTQSIVSNSSGDGISAVGGTPTVTQSTVSNNTGRGIESTGGMLTVSQSTVSNNNGGGIVVSGPGATFTITNNFIVRNGSMGSPVGGVSLAPDASSVFAFNTVVDNSMFGGLGAAGVDCNASGFTAPNNLIVRNTIGGLPVNTYGSCTYPTSIIEGTVTAVMFVSPDTVPFDYKLRAGSSAIDQATTPSPIAVDHEGDLRPQGSAKDVGADEYKP